jgi:hypothetical protein
MGLLKGANLKGLFGAGGIADTFAEAQAYLDGDYGRAMDMAARTRRDRKKGAPGQWQRKDGLTPDEAEKLKTGTPDYGFVPEGTTIEHPLTKERLIFKQGGWKPWQW